jgi:glycyl-tRNA synthetase beta subunit
MWELYNNVTFAMKQSHPSDWMQDHIDVHNFFINRTNNITQEMQADADMFAAVLSNQLDMFES